MQYFKYSMPNMINYEFMIFQTEYVQYAADSFKYDVLFLDPLFTLFPDESHYCKSKSQFCGFSSIVESFVYMFVNLNITVFKNNTQSFYSPNMDLFSWRSDLCFHILCIYPHSFKGHLLCRVTIVTAALQGVHYDMLPREAFCGFAVVDLNGWGYFGWRLSQ